MPDATNPHEPPRLDALRFLYQPVEALSSSETSWHEALVRWYLPDGTVRGPDRVLPYWLEPTRQATFTRFTVERAAEALRAHPEARVSLNLSPRQATHPAALSVLEEVLPALRGRLIVELTEQRYGDVGGLWASLAALGERLHLVLLDDVSCEDLERRWQADAPVDGIKLDRAVLARLRDAGERRRLAPLVRDIAQRFPIVVAEGIEERHEVDLLEGLGVTHIQGFGIGRPGRALAADDLRRRADDATGAARPGAAARSRPASWRPEGEG
jgi:EAL domain-containing protein (putative c-di-GMP-specific phosphodiesterase class I)